MNFIAKIFMGLLGLTFVAGLLVALMGYTIFAALRWLLTGRKPQVVLVWQQFSALRHGAGTGGWRQSSTATAEQNDVVDVQAREVPEQSPRLSADQLRKRTRH